MSDIETAYATAIAAGTLNGAVVLASDASGSFTYTHTAGTRTLLSGGTQPVESTDILYLASATKLMASLAALACVEDGLLTLDGSLASIAPELAAKQVLTGYTEAGSPILEPQTREITLSMLLTHSSGLAYEFIHPLIGKWKAANPAPPASGPDPGKYLVEELISYPLAFQPGSSWMYGMGLDWAGRIVERATGKSLTEYLIGRVFGRLGISDMQFYPLTRDELRTRTVDISAEEPYGTAVAVAGSNEMNLRTRGDFGGHGLFMAASDYSSVLRSLLANDGKVLKPDTVETMFRNHLLPEAQRGLEAAVLSPLGPFFRCGIDEGTKVGYGLGGILTEESVEGWYGKGTMTWGGGMTISWFVDRENGLCGFAAPLPKVAKGLELDVPKLEGLKQVFRKDVYRKRAAARGGKQ